MSKHTGSIGVTVGLVFRDLISLTTPCMNEETKDQAVVVQNYPPRFLQYKKSDIHLIDTTVSHLKESKR